MQMNIANSGPELKDAVDTQLFGTNIALLQDHLHNTSSFCARCDMSELEATLFLLTENDGAARLQVTCKHCTLSTDFAISISHLPSVLQLRRIIQKELLFSQLQGYLYRRLTAEKWKGVIDFFKTNPQDASAGIARYMANTLDYFGHEQGIREAARGSGYFFMISPK